MDGQALTVREGSGTEVTQITVLFPNTGKERRFEMPGSPHYPLQFRKQVKTGLLVPILPQWPKYALTPRPVAALFEAGNQPAQNKARIHVKADPHSRPSSSGNQSLPIGNAGSRLSVAQVLLLHEMNSRSQDKTSQPESQQNYKT